MAYYHGYLVYRLYFLSHFRVQADAEISKFSRAKFGDAVGKRVPVYLSSFVVWFTTGIWHGASWNFIVWGLMNFVVIMISPGTGASVQKVPPPVPGERQEMVRRL